VNYLVAVKLKVEKICGFEDEKPVLNDYRGS
jgi:hypothetical protein